MNGYLALFWVCLVPFATAQTKNSNNNPTGEIGSIAFDEIVVHSNLQVRGKSASRGAKALLSNSTPSTTTTQEPEKISLLSSNSTETASLKRSKRVPRRHNQGQQAYNNGGYGGFPNSGSSAASASSNAFQSNSPFGSFGGSASQASSQSQNFGPGGPQASAGQSASQTYHLPNGNTIDVSFSGGYSFGGNAAPTFSNSHAITVTKPNGQKQHLGRGK